MLGRCGATELVEVAIKPLIDFGVESMVMVTDLLRSLVLLASLGLSGSAVLVSSTDIESVVAGKTAVTSIHVSG